MLTTSREKWKPERAAEIRREIASLWSNAVTATELLEPPTGDAATDANRAKARDFAETRRDALHKLLGMIDAKELPSSADWKEWGRLHQEANRLWGEIAIPPQ